MTSAAIGRSLELYYIDGRPDGMLTAEMFNWTGHVLMAPRTQLSAALARKESAYAGVYLLFGERDGEARAYIGEGEDISDRIKSHDTKKDWWTSAILVTTAGNKLNKAHARYLEARLIEEARKIARTLLDNETNPSIPGLSEADIAKMEAFLENLLVVLPALRVDTFIHRVRPSPAPAELRTESGPPALFPDTAGPEARFVLNNRKHGLTASATFRAGEFIVEAGSAARLTWQGKEAATSGYARLHAELQRAGVLVPDGGACRFAQSYAFSSPSAAAAVVNGRTTNGVLEWRTAAGDENYKEWEARTLTGPKALTA
jgi:hypothetical protein